MNASYESAGARLNYVESGAGFPVVFLHPTPLDHAYWSPLVALLSGIRAIVPDFRGHGASETGSGLPLGQFTRVPDAPALTMERYARDTLTLLEHLSISQAVFVGCSIGGYVMLELWRQASERMRSLAFVCSKPQPDPAPALAKRAENIAKARADGVGALFDGMSRSLVGEFSRQHHPEIIAEVRSRMTVSVDTFIAVQAGLASRPDSVPTVSRIDVPVLAIAGSDDPAVAAQDMEAFRAAPGGCSFHLLSDAGHFAAYEKPEAVAALLQPWLQKQIMNSNG